MGRINAKKRNANASLPEAREAKRKKLSANHLEEDRRLLDSREKALERERALLEKEKSDFERQRKELEREKAEFKKQQDKMKKDKREYEKNQKEFQQEKMKLEKEKLKVGKLEKKAKKFKEVKLSMSRTLDKSKKEKRFLKKKFWKVIHSRNSWKSKRMPNKKSQRKRRKTTLTPRQELEFMVAFNITWSARKRMKSWMRKHEVDFFSITRERDELLKQISPPSNWNYLNIDGTGVLQRANIEEAILMRMNNLNEAGRLKIRENNQTFACVIGDKGAKWTKIGIFFIDVDKSCDPRNIMLLSLYKGDDSAAALRKYCSDVFTQLCEIQGTTYYLGGIELTLMLMLGGDMSLEANVIGRPHVWSFNKFCLICKADKKMSFDMQFQAERMDFESLVEDSDINPEIQKFFPLLVIQPEMIIPSPLHVILGLATDYLKALEKIALGIDRLIYERMDQLLQSYGIAKQAWNHSWTGNHIRKLLNYPMIPLKIRRLFPSDHPSFQRVCYYVDLLNALGPVQSCAEAKILAQEDLSRLKENIENFKNKLFSIEKPPMTSKTHWLLCHVYSFATRFRLWGAAAEHGIEHIHKMFNEDFNRFNSIKSENSLYHQVATLQEVRNFFFDTRE